MQVKELFILNETYQLPVSDYNQFKNRLDRCTGNPMCINNLKYDAESFIAKYARKHASKIENGEESGFIVLDSMSPIIEKSKENLNVNYVQLILFVIAIGLAIAAVYQKSVVYGVLAVILGGALFYNKK